MTDRSSCQQKYISEMYYAGSQYSRLKTLFLTFVEKNDPLIRVLAAFLWPGWGKLSGKNGLDLRAIGGLWARCNSAVFWQTERLYGVFSTRTETEGFTGFSDIVRYNQKGKEAQFGLILLNMSTPLGHLQGPLCVGEIFTITM
jgi:hypothetical protein